MENIREKQKSPARRVAGSVPIKSIPEKPLGSALTDLASRLLVASANLCLFRLTSDAFRL